MFCGQDNRIESSRQQLERLKQVVAEDDINAIKSAIARNDGNISAAARELKVPRLTLSRTMEKLGLKVLVNGPANDAESGAEEDLSD